MEFDGILVEHLYLSELNWGVGGGNNAAAKSILWLALHRVERLFVTPVDFLPSAQWMFREMPLLNKNCSSEFSSSSAICFGAVT